MIYRTNTKNHIKLHIKVRVTNLIGNNETELSEQKQQIKSQRYAQKCKRKP